MSITLIPLKTAVLLSPARSASTSLRMTLDKHPEIAMHGELFGPNAIHGVSSKLNQDKLSRPGIYHRNINTQSFTNIFFPDDKYVYGVNLLFSHWFTPDNFRFIDGLMTSKPKVILLWRRDLLARLKSELLFKFNSSFISLNHLENFTLAQAIADFDKQVYMFKSIQSDLRQLDNLVPFRIDFEDMITKNGKVALKEIQDYLGVDYYPVDLLQDIQRNKRLDQNEAIALIDDFISKNMDSLQCYRNVEIQ